MRRIAGLHPGESKTDVRGAFIIAEAARTMPHTLRSIQIAGEQLAELTTLCGFDDDLAKQATAKSKPDPGLLTKLHPALERVLCPRLDHPAVLDLLRTWPPAEALRHAGRRQIENRLTRLAPRMGERLAGEIIDAVDQPTATVVRTNAATMVLPQFARMLADIRESRDTVFTQVEALVEAHPLHPVLTSPQEVGLRAAVRILSDIVREDFASAGPLASDARLAPVTWRSATSIRGDHPSRKENKILKRALFLSAFAALKDPRSRACNDRKRAEGKRHNQALIAVARRRSPTLYAMLRDGTLYEPRTRSAA